MFEYVRTNRTLQIVFGGLIILLFVFSGIQGYSRFMGGGDAIAVGEVDGHDITKAEWDQAHRQNTERMRQQRPNLDPKLLDSPEARRQSLDGLVHERVVAAASFHDKLLVSDERIAQILRTDPQFAMLVNADPKMRQSLLEAQHLTEASLVERLRSDISNQQVLMGVSQSAFVPGSVSRTALDALLERREVHWQLFDTRAYLDKAQPTEADLQAYYAEKAHAAQFRAPEEAQIEYLVLDLNALKAQFTVSESDLQDYYKANQSRYSQAEERRVSHILVKLDPKASAAEKQKAQSRADELLAAVRKAPSSFADVARKSSDDAGSAPQGGDLDFMSRGALEPALENAVFAMKQGEISNAVAGSDGLHIFQLTGVRGGAVKPFAEVRPQIEDEVRKQLAQKAYPEKAEQFTNLVYEQADSLQPAVDKFKLTRQTATVQRKPAPDAKGVLASERLLEALFSADSVRTKHNTEAVETAPNTLVSARIVQYKPEHQLPLAEVKDKVMDAVKRAQAAAAARKDGEAKLAALRKDPNEALPQSTILSRAQGGTTPRPLLDAALKADVAKGPVVTGVDLGDNGYIALRVVKALPRDPAEPQTDSAKQLVEQSLEEAESQAYFEALKARYKARVDDKRVASAIALGASSAQ